MTSSIINFVINKFLYNFLEINPDQTYISLLSGELVLKNVKLKKNLFDYVNIDYLELINGYIGSIRILLQMPNFFSNPIKIYINDLFIYSKQKKIESINEKEIKKYLITNKSYKLSSDEQLYQQLDEIKNQNENFVSQIINNLNIFINNIIFRFDDPLSNPKNPFSVCLISKSFNIISYNEIFYSNLDNTSTNIKNDQNSFSRKSSKNNIIDKKYLYFSDNDNEISDKKIIVDNLYFYIDCFDKVEDLKFEKFIDEKMRIKMKENLEFYIDEISKFYYYCQSELNVHCYNKNAHEYVFYQLNLDINFSMNFVLENNNPQYQIYINNIENFDIFFTIKQMSSFFNLLSYYNLYYYYKIGLTKSIFNINLNQTEKRTYVLDYIDYYYNKFIKKNNNYNLSNFIKEKEEKITYEDIKKLRKVALKNIKLYIKIKEIEEKIEQLKNKWSFFNGNQNEINDLENKLVNMKKLLNETVIKLNKGKTDLKNYQSNPDNQQYTNAIDTIENYLKIENDPYSNLPDNFILYLIQMNVKNMHIIIFDDEYINENRTRKRYKKILDINFINFFIKISVGIKIFNLYFDISDMSVTQEIIKSNDYDIMLMTHPKQNNKSKKDKKVLLFEFEINPNENFTYKIILKNEKKLIFILNLYELQYILYKILTALYTSISFLDLSQYSEGNINKYLRIGYALNDEKRQKNKNVKNYYNYNCNIDIISPLIIIPQNILDISNNKCILINLGDISLKSNLVNKTIRNYLKDSSNPGKLENNENFEVYTFSSSSSFDVSNISDDFYDSYNLSIKGFNVLISNECIKSDYFSCKNSSCFINKTDIIILYKTLIIPEDFKLNNIYLNITIKQIEMNLDEFQIFLLIVFFKQMKTQSDMLNNLKEKRDKDLNISNLNNTNVKVLELFKRHLIKKGILIPNNYENQKERNISNNLNEVKILSYTKEEDFLNKKNDYFYEINIEKIKFTIFKKFPDLSNQIFLETQIDLFEFKMCGNLIKDSLMKINMRNLKLFDKEKDINNEYLVIKEYQNIIKNNKNDKNTKEDMFSYSNIYIDNLKENISEMKLCNIDIIITFDSLTRMYVFSMYYYKIFYENYLNSNTQNNQKLLTEKSLSKSMNGLERESTIITKLSKMISNKEHYRKEIIKNKFIFQIKIIDNYILLPYNSSSLTCPILSLSLNMFYDQSSDREIINVYDNYKNYLVQTLIKPNNSYLNLMIYESDFDLIKYNIKNKQFINNKKMNKILSNYRIQFTNKYSNLEVNKQSLSEINIFIEPIIIDISLEQLKDILIFYNKLMTFLYENLYEYYIPYVKPENVIYFQGKPYINKKKLTFKRLIYRIYILIKIKKSFNNKNKKNLKNDNIFNSFSSMNIIMNKAAITIFDNTLNGKNKLLELKLTKMFYKSINNSKPKDKNNVIHELIGIISGKPYPFQNFTVHNLYKYMDISFILEFNYYNLEYNSFEPIIEPLPFQYLSYQVDKIFIHKTLIKSENILNFNVSSNCIKVLNLFLCKYYSENELLKRTSDLKFTEKKMIEENSSQKDDKIVLILINKTGVQVKFWFDFNEEEIYTLKNMEFMKFSNKTLYKSRRKQIKIQQKTPDKNTFSFQILGYEIISKINLNKHNILHFKTNINDNKYLLYSVIINTSGLVNKIKFFSSIYFYNKTIFDELIISIDDNNIKDNFINLRKKKRTQIPLSWMLSNNKIYFQLRKNSEKHILYNNILDCVFCQKLDDEKLEENKNEKIQVKEKLTNALNESKEFNLQHPKYKEYISAFIGQKFNIQNDIEAIKRMTIIDENEGNKSYSFNLNYLALSFNEKGNQNNGEIYKKLKNTEKSYRYLIIISPLISITNYIPFNIMCTTDFEKNNDDNNIISIDPLKTKEIYDINWELNKKKSLFKLSLIYEDNIFHSKKFPLMEDTNENLLKKVNLIDNNSNSIISNILVKQSDEEINSLFEVVEQFSISSIHFILFFDYIINNRMEFNIYAKEQNNDDNENNSIYLFKKNKLSLLSSVKDIHQLNISITNSEFNEKNIYFLNSIGLNKNIELLREDKIYNISCTTLSSVDFIYSSIILFEPKYILINNLDFDIYYFQITDDKKRLIETIKKNDKMFLSYQKNNDKNLFKIGMKVGSKFSWSGPFNIDESKDYDFKIEINKELSKKYRKYSYNIGNTNYINFRIKYKIYQYTTYIFLSFFDFPDLKIINRTSETVKIYEDEENSPIIVEPRKDIPFIWEDTTNIKDKLICFVKGWKYYFSFSIFNETKIKFKKKYIIITVRRNNNGSRCLMLEEISINSSLRNHFMKKQLKLLSEIIIDLKGIGLSFLDETPKEIFFISFYGIKLVFKNTMLLKNRENIQQIDFNLKNFQIDYCLNDSLKSLIYPKIQKIPSLEEDNKKDNIDFINISIVKTSYISIENKVQYMNYNNISLSIQEMNIKINQIILMHLINLIQGYTSLLDYAQKIKKKSDIYIKEDNLIENNDKFLENLKNGIMDGNKTLINRLALSSIKINLTLRIDLSNIEISFLPEIISNTIISLGSSLIRITEGPLSFKSKVIHDIYMDINAIISILIKEFTTEGIFQIYKLLGSSDLIGNPVNLIGKIGNGFYELVNEPTKALMKNPTQLGIGLAKGVTGLLNGVVGGSLDSVSKITGTLYTTVHGILGKKETVLIDEDDEPENLLVGAKQGITGGYQELKEGVTGLFMNPFQNAQKSGALGFIEGLSTGIFGFAISPFAFALRLGGSIAVGTKNTFAILYNKSLKNQRFRFPRYIEESKPLQNYDSDLSAAKEFLTKLINVENPIILYFSSFICNNDGYKEKLAFLIVTKKLFLILSNENKIILNVKISDLKEIKLSYFEENFIIILELNNQKKNMVVSFDKSSVVIACQLYDILKDEINLLSE